MASLSGRPVCQDKSKGKNEIGYNASEDLATHHNLGKKGAEVELVVQEGNAQ